MGKPNIPQVRGVQALGGAPAEGDGSRQRGEEVCGGVNILFFFFFFVLRIEENRSNYERKIIQLFGVNSFPLQANQIFVFRGRKENA